MRRATQALRSSRGTAPGTAARRRPTAPRPSRFRLRCRVGTRRVTRCRPRRTSRTASSRCWATGTSSMSTETRDRVVSRAALRKPGTREPHQVTAAVAGRGPRGRFPAPAAPARPAARACPPSIAPSASFQQRAVGTMAAPGPRQPDLPPESVLNRAAAAERLLDGIQPTGERPSASASPTGAAARALGVPADGAAVSANEGRTSEGCRRSTGTRIRSSLGSALQRHLLQTGYADQLIRQLIARLRDAGDVRPRAGRGHRGPRRVLSGRQAATRPHAGDAQRRRGGSPLHQVPGRSGTGRPTTRWCAPSTSCPRSPTRFRSACRTRRTAGRSAADAT